MVRGFVMVKTTTEDTERVLAAVHELEAVKEGHVVAGDWDIIAELDVPEVYDILSTVSDQVRSLDGVTDTKTYVSMSG